MQFLFWLFYKKVFLWFYLIYGHDSNAKFSSICLEDGLNGLHNKSLALSLLEICCSSSSSSPSNVLQVLWISFKSFKDSWNRIFLELELLENLVLKMRRCPLLIVVLEDKLHFELICLKICSKFFIGPYFV